jgi:antitoxin StbD
MAELVPITEARAKLSQIVRDSDHDDVLLLNHGRPAAVVISARRYSELLEQLDDFEDRLSVYEHDGVTISFDKLMAEMGLD